MARPLIMQAEGQPVTRYAGLRYDGDGRVLMRCPDCGKEHAGEPAGPTVGVDLADDFKDYTGFQASGSGDFNPYVADPDGIKVDWVRAFRKRGEPTAMAWARFRLSEGAPWQTKTQTLTKEQPVLWLAEGKGIDLSRLFVDA